MVDNALRGATSPDVVVSPMMMHQEPGGYAAFLIVTCGENGVCFDRITSVKRDDPLKIRDAVIEELKSRKKLVVHVTETGPATVWRCASLWPIDDVFLQAMTRI
jgi:hypothetical protein